MRKNSYISKLFTILSVLLAGITILMSMSIYNYSKIVIRDEIADLNNAILRQVSEGTSRVIADSVGLCNKIAYDSRLIELLRSSSTVYKEGEQREKTIAAYVDNTISNYVWSGSRHKNLFEAHVMEYNDINKEAFMTDADTVLINTSWDPMEEGVYRYTFQVVREIRDHITQVPYGFVILNISENVLYDTYYELITGNNKIFIIDENGTIISNKDKRLIGKKYLNSDGIDDKLLKQDGYNIIKNDTNTSMILLERIQGTQWYLIKEMGIDTVWQPLQNIKIVTFIITIIGIFVLLILSRYFSKKTSEPIVGIRNKMEQVTKGNLDVRADIKNNDEFGQIAKSFNEMVQQIKYLLITIKEEERKKRLAELDFLRAQINPHFIYNTLSSIRFYVEMNKNTEAEEMLFRFSKILRKTLSRSNEFIKIRDEIKTIEDYVQLQKLRYTDSFKVLYDISEDILDYMIPTFILQPIVENSIFYNVGEQKIALITITGKYEDNKIKIIISDNGIGMSKEQIDKAFNKEVQVNKVGLINVHERIQLNYGMEYGLDIVSQDGKGTQVIFTLPA